MNGRAVLRRVRRVWIIAGISGTVIFVVWSLIAYRANGEARAATRSDSVVSVTRDRGVWRMMPASATVVHRTALVFFPGALVDPRAYAPLTRAVAEAGFPALIVELPRRAAFGGADSPELDSRFRRVVASLSDSMRIVIAGHSRGAVVASREAAAGFPGFAGLALIGSSHPRDVDLSALDVPVVKIAGTRDGLASPEEVRGNADKVPPSATWVWVEGGNHSQFGWYGFQPGDRFAAVDAAVQRQQMVTAVLALLQTVDAAEPTDSLTPTA